MSAGDFWERHPLLAWAILSVAFAGAFVVFLWFDAHTMRKYDNYWYCAVYWSAIVPWLYRKGVKLDRRKRMKPSPFFFWFSGE